MDRSRSCQTGAHPESHEEAAEALREICDPRAVDPLIGSLKDRDHEVREEAAEALGKIGDKRATETLNVMFADPRCGERPRAASPGCAEPEKIGRRPVTPFGRLQGK